MVTASTNRHLDDAYRSAVKLMEDQGHDAAMVKSGDDIMVVVVRGEKAVSDMQEVIEAVMVRWDRRVRRKIRV